MSRSLPQATASPEKIATYVNGFFRQLDQHGESFRMRPFYAFVRWKVLELLKQDCKKGGRMKGRKRERQGYERLVQQAFSGGEYSLKTGLLQRLCSAYGFSRFDDVPIIDLTVQEFQELIAEALDQIFDQLSRFPGPYTFAGDLLQDLEDENKEIALVAAPTQEDITRTKAMEEHMALKDSGPQSSGITPIELNRALKESRAENGGPTGPDDKTWSIGYRTDWTPDSDEDLEEGAQPC